MVSIEYYDGKQIDFEEIDFQKVLSKYIFTCYGETSGGCEKSDNIDDWVAELDEQFDSNVWDEKQGKQRLLDAWDKLQNTTIWRLLKLEETKQNETIQNLFENVFDNPFEKKSLKNKKFKEFYNTNFTSVLTGVGPEKEGWENKIPKIVWLQESGLKIKVRDLKRKGLRFKMFYEPDYTSYIRKNISGGSFIVLKDNEKNEWLKENGIETKDIELNGKLTELSNSINKSLEQILDDVRRKLKRKGKTKTYKVLLKDIEKDNQFKKDILDLMYTTFEKEAPIDGLHPLLINDYEFEIISPKGKGVGSTYTLTISKKGVVDLTQPAGVVAGEKGIKTGKRKTIGGYIKQMGNFVDSITSRNTEIKRLIEGLQ